VIFLGCTPDDLYDPFDLPKGVTGPFVVSGNNRFAILFLTGFRRLICLELINEFPREDFKWRKFYMKVYCFDNPTDPKQRLAIRTIGSLENEVQQNFIKMSDADKLATTKLNIEDARKRGVPGFCYYYFSYLFSGDYAAGDRENTWLVKAGQ